MKKRCFVVMGFGIKTDYATGRKLDLNKSYRLLIKPVVENKGLECIRADEIMHSGLIDVPMYRELLSADIVIADLSTANANALYELGVRHALRPRTTIVISEDKLAYPFDFNHINITSYTHLGDAIDYDEVERFRKKLDELLEEVMKASDLEKPDSPVYTYLRLIPPKLERQMAEAASTAGKGSPKTGITGKALSSIIDEAEEALGASQFEKARDLFKQAHEIGKEQTTANKSGNDPYIIQRLALCTYKAKQPDAVSALKQALDLLMQIDLAHTNDPETVSQAGAIEKKLYEATGDVQHLSNAILYFQRGYYLLNNRYNGINLAFAFNLRANSSLCSNTDEVIADLIYANHTRKRVLYLCEKDWDNIVTREAVELVPENEDAAARKYFFDEQRFWILINRAEASFGLGDFDTYNKAKEQASKIEHHNWMMDAFDLQISKLRLLLQAQGHLLSPKWEEV